MRESFVGVDVAKAELVVAGRPEGPTWTASNDAEGIVGTVARLQSLGPRLIVLEATGGYERAVVAALAAAGLPIVVADPGRCATSRKPPANLVGVAPLARDSGTLRGKRTVWGAGRRCGRCCTWGPSWRPAATRSFARSTGAS